MYCFTCNGEIGNELTGLAFCTSPSFQTLVHSKSAPFYFWKSPCNGQYPLDSHHSMFPQGMCARGMHSLKKKITLTFYKRCTYFYHFGFVRVLLLKKHTIPKCTRAAATTKQSQATKRKGLDIADF